MEKRTLGDYHVIKSIGQGTLGTVYLAEHRFMKRQFVLKVLPEELASDRGFVQRFEEEIGFLASLDHPNIVKIHTISFSQGHYFLVSDCIVDELGETTNLNQYLTALGRPLEEKEIFSILKQIAQALDYAHHKKGIVHRSLKLNNILIGKNKDHGFPEVYLSDFGLFRIIGPGAVLTRIYKNMADALGIASSVLQKPIDRYPNPPVETQKLIPLHASFLQNYAFLAPEQKKLDLLHAIDGKTDVYAFGVLAYFLLTGEFPEGVFDMPSHREYRWDVLLEKCLNSNHAKRSESLTESLKEIHATEPSYSALASKYVMQNIKAVEIEAPLIAVPHAIPEQQDEFKEGLKPIFTASQLERPKADLDPAAIFNIDTSVKQYTPELKETGHIQPLLTDMIVVRGGVFARGSKDGNRDEMPRHQVTLNSFAIDIHPVTNEQFVRFLEIMGGEKDNYHNDIIRLRDSRIKRSAGRLMIESGYNKHPVVGVTWYGAIAYAKWVGKRLPTEAEWEIAARGERDNVLYPTGDDIEKTQANFFSSDTTAVMSYNPNGFGLYDMAGNVYEWCYDWYGYNYYEISLQEPENPKGPLQGVYRVLRGGCWKSLKEDLRCSRRHRNNPGTVNGTYGFRCAADVEKS